MRLRAASGLMRHGLRVRAQDQSAEAARLGGGSRSHIADLMAVCAKNRSAAATIRSSTRSGA